MDNFPLRWPQAMPRTGWRSPSKFRVRQFGRARDAVLSEVKLTGGKLIALTSNMPLRQDGLPRLGSSDLISDPGVAVHFEHPKRGRLVVACDRWRSVGENLWAVAKSLEAIRAIGRWGTADMVDAALGGFRQLPAPDDARGGDGAWWVTLNVTFDATIDEIDSRARAMLAEVHPDTPGADETKFRMIAQARDSARKARGSALIPS